MTAAVIPIAEATPRAPLRGAIAELLLAGGITFALFPLAWVARRALGLDAADYAAGFLTFYGAYVINDPHFTVTYFLFYKDARRRALGDAFSRPQRIRYCIAGVLVPAALVLWAALALLRGSAQSIGWMVQLMFLLVGWHYAKQGFGVLNVLLARRGTSLSPRERAAFLAHAYAAWGFAWANPSLPAGEYEEKGVIYAALAHPRWLEITAGSILAVTTVWLAVLLFQRWRRDRSLPLAPLAIFLATIWLWTIYTTIDPLVRYVIPALHSVQYLYFVWLMRRNEARAFEGPPQFGRPAAVRVAALAVSALGLGWLLFHGAPSLFDTARAARLGRHGNFGDLGETPYFAAFYVVVNIHHYFMDYVIWRRENPETRYLRVT